MSVAVAESAVPADGRHIRGQAAALQAAAQRPDRRKSWSNEDAREQVREYNLTYYIERLDENPAGGAPLEARGRRRYRRPAYRALATQLHSALNQRPSDSPPWNAGMRGTFGGQLSYGQSSGRHSDPSPWKSHCAGYDVQRRLGYTKHPRHRENHSGIRQQPVAFSPESLFALPRNPRQVGKSMFRRRLS